MRKIVVGAQVSLDGVMQAPGGPTEDPTKGFDDAFGEEIDRLFKQKFDGRGKRGPDLYRALRARG